LAEWTGHHFDVWGVSHTGQKGVGILGPEKDSLACAGTPRAVRHCAAGVGYNVGSNGRDRRAKRRLLLVAHAFPPNPAAGSARAWRLYKYLPEFGYETHVITASRAVEPRERVQYVAVPKFKLIDMALRVCLLPYDEAATWTLPALRAARRLMAQTPMDAVISTVPFLCDHVVGMALKTKYGTAWIADYRDPIVGNPFRKAHGMSGWVDRFCDGRFFAHADRLVAVTDQARQDWVKRCPEVAWKTAVIWNGFDPEEAIAPMPLPERPYRLISHFGSFYYGRSPVPVLATARRLIERGALDPKTVRFRFVGFLDSHIEAQHKELFERLAALGCLELLPQVSHAEALRQMMETDSLLLADNNGTSIGHTVPAKLFEYIRVCRPILALTHSQSPVEHILAMSGARFVTLTEEMEAVEADARLLQFLHLPTEPGTLSRDFLDQFNGRNQARKMAELIDGILDARLSPGGTFTEETSKELVEV